MPYKLQITQYVENKNYKDELKDWKESTRYSGFEHISHPDKNIEERKLDIEITDTEWEAIKKEVLKVI